MIRELITAVTRCVTAATNLMIELVTLIRDDRDMSSGAEPTGLADLVAAEDLNCDDSSEPYGSTIDLPDGPNAARPVGFLRWGKTI